MIDLNRVNVLLSVHRALLMAITPEMRVIDVSWNQSEIRLRFVFEAAGDYDINELTNEIEAEIEADFLPAARVRSEVEYVPTGTPIRPISPLDGGHERVFARRSERSGC